MFNQHVRTTCCYTTLLMWWGIVQLSDIRFQSGAIKHQHMPEKKKKNQDINGHLLALDRQKWWQKYGFKMF